MASTDPIAWNEGMILTPQHLQQNDLRFERLLQIIAGIRCSYPWGVSILQLDDTTLTSGEVSLTRASGLFPSGFSFDYDSQTDDLLSAKLPTVREGSLIQVFLGLRKPLIGGVLFSGKEGRLTFGKEEDTIDNLTGEKSGIGGVGRLRALLSLHFTTDQADRYELLPIARIRYRGNTYLREQYSPPTYALSPQHPIHRYCVGLSNLLREKIALLSDALSMPGAAQDSRTELHRRVFEAIFREIPSFEIRLSLPDIHPEELYFDLCRLAAVVISSVHSRGMPRMIYRHDDLVATFGVIGESLREAITQVEAMFLTKPFIRGEKHFELEKAAASEGDLVIGVQVSDPAYRNDAVRWFEQAHIGSSRYIEDIVARRISGAQRKQVDAYSPFGIKEDSKTALFIITATPEYLQDDETLYIEGAALGTGLTDLSLFLFSDPKKLKSTLR